MMQQETLIMKEEVALRSEILDIARMRLEAGDISALEASAFHLSFAWAQDNLIRSIQKTKREELNLNNLMGLGMEPVQINIEPPAERSLEIAATEVLIKRALAARPDVRAAELEITASAKKAGWEKSKIFNLTAALDWNEKGSEGSELGPGLQMELPIFNQNNGGRAKAEVAVEMAAKNYLLVQQRIVMDVRQAQNDFLSAKEELELLRDEIVPIAETAGQNATKSYEEGELSYLELLTFKRSLLDARLRMTAVDAELWKSSANLQFAVGSRFIQPEQN
jgi:cobalt-zinc-cadmium efflux system outer membrane protein